jgi:hypothetical protein
VLRVTQTTDSSGLRVVKLEGKLLQPWIADIRALFPLDGPAAVFALDLSELTFADQAGTQLLGELVRRGSQIQSCSPFVAELLHRESRSC